jgi:hypothetical protein
MTTIRRRQRVSYRELGPYKRHELLTGQIKYPAKGYSGYGDGKGTNLYDFISDEMRADWAEHRDDLLQFWAGGEYTTTEFYPDSLPWLFARGSPNSLPWAERQFGGSWAVDS